MVAAFGTAPVKSLTNQLTWIVARVVIMKLNRAEKTSVAQLIAPGLNGPIGQPVHVIAMAVNATVPDLQARG